MSSAYLLIALSLLMLGGVIWVYFWCVDNGQFDDMERKGMAALEGEDLREDRRSDNGRDGWVD